MPTKKIDVTYDPSGPRKKGDYVPGFKPKKKRQTVFHILKHYKKGSTPMIEKMNKPKPILSTPAKKTAPPPTKKKSLSPRYDAIKNKFKKKYEILEKKAPQKSL